MNTPKYHFSSPRIRRFGHPISSNPMTKKAFTLKEYNNWHSESPKFTYKDYNSYFLNAKLK